MKPGIGMNEVGDKIVSKNLSKISQTNLSKIPQQNLIIFPQNNPLHISRKSFLYFCKISDEWSWV